MIEDENGSWVVEVVAARGDPPSLKLWRTGCAPSQNLDASHKPAFFGMWTGRPVDKACLKN